MAKSRKTGGTRRGRPPAGVRPGERITDYPQISVRLPPEVRLLLDALSDVLQIRRWQLLGRALDCLIDQLPPGKRQRVRAMMRRSSARM